MQSNLLNYKTLRFAFAQRPGTLNPETLKHGTLQTVTLSEVEVSNSSNCHTERSRSVKPFKPLNMKP